MLMGIPALKRPTGRWLAMALLVALAMSGASASLAHARNRPQKVTVHSLATGTLLRGSWGLNQDIYLAEILLKNDASARLVRIVDEYSEFAPPLSRQTLIAAEGTMLRIRRDETCDVTYAGMHLRAAPGDPIALLNEPLFYQPHLLNTPDPEELLPCYRVVRPI